MTAISGSSRSTSPMANEYAREGWWPGERLEDRFRRLTNADPDHLALVDDHGVALTRNELWQRARGVADELAASGLAAGDPVLICLPNSAYWQVAFLACLQLQAVPATLPVTSDEATVEHVVDLIGARGAIVSEDHRGRPIGSWLRRVSESHDWAVTLVVVGANDELNCTRTTGEQAPLLVPDVVDHLMFTSSTTGMPKAVMHTADTLAAVNMAFSLRFGVNEDTPIFMPSPMGHSVGAWHGARLSLFTGATLVLQESWDPERGLALIEEHGCSFTAAATPFLKDIVDVPWSSSDPKMPTLRSFLCGGAPVPPSLLEMAARQAPHTFVTVLWGMTEGAGTTCVPESTQQQLTSTAGKPVDGLELRILKPDDNGVGELAIRGPGVFVGYLGQDDLYHSLLTSDGFFRTGDLASIDADEYLHLTGRLKDLIIRGGVNISPLPIEDAIAAHPAVRRVAVVGKSDERLGELICAVIVPKGTAPTLPDLNEWLTEHGLSRRQLPEVLRIVEQMPVTAAGKIRKTDLRSYVDEENA